jgi:catecholate siderophore receptor
MNDQVTKRLTAIIMAHGLALAASGQSTNATPQQANTNATSKLPDVVVKGQQQNAEPMKPETVQSPKYTEPLRDIPQTITVVPRAVMEQQNATTLRDVLRNVPGISYQAGEGGVPAGDNLSIRGFNARTDIFVDNVRDFGGYTRDPFNIEQVEVAKGPGSTFAGRGSSGGTVNLVSKVPTIDPFYAGSFGVGTEDYKRLTLDVNQPIEKSPMEGTSIRLNGMWTEANTPDRDEVGGERWGIAPSVKFGIGTPTRVTLSYVHLQQDNVPDYGIPWVPENTGPLARYSDKPAPVSFENWYGLKNRDFEHTRTDIATALVEHDFNEKFSLRNTMRYGRSDRDSVITAPRFVDLDPTTNSVSHGNLINRQIQSRDQSDAIFNNQADLTSRVDTWKFNHTIVGSIEFAHETSENYARTGAVSRTTIFNPNPSDPVLTKVLRNGAHAEAEATSLALALFDTVKLSEQWQVQGGLRWDYFKTEFQNITNGIRHMRELTRTDHEVNWRAGVVYQPREEGSIYAAYGTSFNPSAEGLTLGNATNSLNNFKLDPEESRTYEVGTKWDLLENRLSLGLAVFRTEKTNARTDDGVNTTADLVVLEGEQYVQGVEVSAAGKITDKWQVFGGYAFMESEITESKNRFEIGNELANTPNHTFSLWTTYQLPLNFEVGAGAQYKSSRFSSNLNNRKAPGYVTFDAMAGWKPNDHFGLQLNVYNLADEEYIDQVGGGHFVPGAGTMATLTANFKF